jgi:hypothetical protein
MEMRIFLNIMIIIVFSLLSNIYAQIAIDFHIDSVSADRGGLVGNGVTDLIWENSKLYVGTGYGLSITPDKGDTWQNFTEKQYGGKGGISAISIDSDSTIWIATGYDTTVQEGQDLPAGGGLRYLLNGSNEWVYIPQPKDSLNDTAGGKRPTTTHVQNITYDIALLDTQIWIASFGGGIRRSLDMGQNWDVITTDGLPFSAGDHLNHRGFSVMAENNNIWVGTAGGISKSSNGGYSWDRFFVGSEQIPEPGGISGNWVIALAYNSWNNSVWAVTLSTGGDEYNSVGMTMDGGYNWQNFLVDELSDGTFARYIAFYDSAVYVATEKGVYKSINNGRTWYKFPMIIDNESGERILTDEFYSVATSPAGGHYHGAWLGSGDGLALSEDNGYTWTVFRSFVSTRERTYPAVYAYPNPFSPARGTFIRFQYDITRAGEIKIDIYNFAMENVTSIRTYESNPTPNTLDRSAFWNGRDSNNRIVANGVYFFRAEVEGKVTWGKIVVID